LATTKVLMAAVQAGIGRETAHEVIKKHATEVALDMRAGQGDGGKDLIDRLVADPRLGLDATVLAGLLAEPLQFTGASRAQVAAVVAAVARVAEEYPGAADYTPEPIL